MNFGVNCCEYVNMYFEFLLLMMLKLKFMGPCPNLKMATSSRFGRRTIFSSSIFSWTLFKEALSRLWKRCNFGSEKWEDWLEIFATDLSFPGRRWFGTMQCRSRRQQTMATCSTILVSTPFSSDPGLPGVPSMGPDVRSTPCWDSTDVTDGQILAKACFHLR